MSYNIPPNTNQGRPMPHYNQRPPSHLPMMPVKEQTQMWHQNSYMGDSGVHSGASTQVPSLTGKEEDTMELPRELHQQQQNPFMSDSGVHSTGASTQVPSLCGKEEETDLFNLDTHSFSNTNNNTNTIKDENNQIVPIFPQDEMPDVKPNLMDCQNESDLSAHIPNLIKLLGDEDQVVVCQAAAMAHDLLKRDSFRFAMLNNNPELLNNFIATLVHAITYSNDIETTKRAVGTMQVLSHHRHGLAAILDNGGVPALVRLLSSPQEGVLFFAITTLHNLLLHHDESKAAVRVAGGLQKLVTLLRRNNIKFLTVVTDCLQILAYGNQDSKLMILASQGPLELVRIMQTYDYEKLLWTTSRVLKVLSVCSSNKPAIIEAGGLAALSRHLRSPSLRLVQNCLWTLRNLSDAATKVTGLNDLLIALVESLSSKDIQVVTCASGVLANLTCNNEWNKKVVYKCGGMTAILRTILIAENRVEITDPLVCTLRHLTSKSGFSDRARKDFIEECNGLQVVMKLMHSPGSWALVKALIGLIRNLGLYPGNCGPLRDCGAVHQLVQLMMRAFQEMQKKPINGGVKMEDIIEGTVSTLQILSRDSYTRSLMTNQQMMIVPMLVRLIYHSNNENIQRAAGGILCELSTDKEGLDLIAQEGATNLVNELMASRNEDMRFSRLLDQNQNKTSCHNNNMKQVTQGSAIFQDDNLWNSDFEMVAELQEILSSDQTYDNIYNPEPHGNNQQFQQQQQGFNIPPVDVPGLELGSPGDATGAANSASSYSALFEAMEVTMADTVGDSPDLGSTFGTLNHMPSTPQDNQQNGEWFDGSILKTEY